ncbi:Uncharacterised protein [Clostridium disporicum]|uniref:Uncharacterized protein n=2 Tax=Clostridium disporicum TaxID=84024 RepID=A0A174AL59_9CLOT|nr:Uncharacterised protein [Clostridium disporicum]SCJ28074.1 Uncharacterised protein [uncultured Clostridium sp.]
MRIMNLKEELENLKKRHIEDELQYIWDYSKKTGFAQYITEENKEWIKNNVVYHGFVVVQQAIKRTMYKRDKSEKEYTFAMVIREFKQQLYLLTVDKDKLERIQAYREGQKLYQKQLEEWKAFEKQQLEKFLDVEKFNNFEERDRSESSSYMSYEEIEYQLLGWDK